eukprot:PhF_6_TR37121/c0_g1_i1/m.54557
MNPSVTSDNFDPREDPKLYYCIAITNPYYSDDGSRGVKGDKQLEATNPYRTSGDGATVPLMASPTTTTKCRKRNVDTEPDTFGFTDDDYLGDEKTPKEKIVNLTRRLTARGVVMLPSVLSTVQSVSDLDTLNASGLLSTSPDKDQLYILVFTPVEVLKEFAETQQITMRTHPYSDLGGYPWVFSKARDEELAASVQERSDMVPDSLWRNGGHTNNPYEEKSAHGFMLELPQRARLLERVLKTPWAFGGCGLQIDELIRGGVLIEAFFPLHSAKLAELQNLHDWASLKTVFSANALNQPHNGIRLYFGETVAIYFYWLQSYTVYLFVPALVGTGIGMYGSIYGSYNNVTMSFFSLFMIVWSVCWLKVWNRKESQFASATGTDIEIAEEMVRDEFQGEERVLDDEQLFKNKFQYPLTLFRSQDGTLYEKADNFYKRYMLRVFVTYPVTMALVGGLIWSLIAITDWRFDTKSDPNIESKASAVTVIVMAVFGIVFDKIVTFLNDLENNRTASEYESSLVLKSFLFYFCNSYSALFILMLYPHSGVSNANRLDSLSSQLLMILVVKPFIQDVTELFQPYAMRSWRSRKDYFGTSWGAVKSYFRCDHIPPQEHNLNRVLWMECQKDAYTTTMSDYLEVALQYGYMTMFACAFPWGPAASFLYNILEIRIDAVKVMHESQRARSAPAIGIGSWNFVFRALLLISICTNAYIVSFQSSTFQDLHWVGSSEKEKVVGFVVVQYVFIGCLLGVFVALPSLPVEVMKSKAKQQILHVRYTLRHGKKGKRGGGTATINSSASLDHVGTNATV